MSDPVPDDVQRALRISAGRRGRFGEPLVFFVETGSTNDVAGVLADRGATEGTTVLAGRQTAGRGRLGREWFSPPGAGLYASVVCRTLRAAPLLTLAGGVAVATGIRCATGLPVTLKWPNDVVVFDPGARGQVRKLAGILAEGSSGAGGLQHVVLGFGVNMRPASYPPALAGLATSLEAELGREVDSGVLLAETLVALNEEVSALEDGEAGAVLDRWRQLAPLAAGSTVEWRAGGTTRRGTASGIDDQGALLVRVGGSLERIVAGEVKWI